MTIKVLIIFFSISPLIAAFFDNLFFKYFPVLILVLWLLTTILVNKKILKIPLSFSLILLITLIHAFIQVLWGLGNGSGGIILLLIEAFIFYQLFNLYKKIDFDNLISFFLKLSLSYLYFEFFTRLFGFEYIFVELFGYAENVTKFKTYNSAPWYTQAFGFKGLNSFFLGSQIASMLSLLTLIYFIGKKFFLKQNNFKLNILIILSLFMYLITMTQASNLLFVLIILFIFFFIPSFIGLKKISVKSFLLLFIGINLFFFSDFILTKMIFFKLNESKDVEIYLSLFFDPYNEYLKLNLNQILLGIGRSKWTFDASTDLGFFGILFRTGLPYFFIISLFFIFCITKSLKQSFNKENSSYLSFHLLINSFFIFIYWGSLIHYTSSVELGCREIFAFQIAYFFFNVKKKNIYVKQN